MAKPKILFEIRKYYNVNSISTPFLWEDINTFFMFKYLVGYVVEKVQSKSLIASSRVVTDISFKNDN